jgi:branched-chain amino acid transport system permease protein
MLGQIIINSLSVGAIYGLAAIGFVMLLKSIDLVNFAQGDLVMAGAFIGLLFYGYIGLPFIVSFALTIVTSGFIGILIESQETHFNVYGYGLHRRLNGYEK